MEGLIRKPFQGVSNIIRFNWHYYVIAAVCMIALCTIIPVLSDYWQMGAVVLFSGFTLSILISLSISHYIYDRSSLYSLSWLDNLKVWEGVKLVNIHAGFDETSALLKQKFQEATLTAFDFYDPVKHTEVSIKRARKSYALYPGTKAINTLEVPLKENSTDYIFLILSAHEIRNWEERIRFFSQLRKALTNNGRIVVVEHLRDISNFIAYNIGFFHFFSRRTWNDTWNYSELDQIEELKITPFTSAFILQKNGTTS